jgi:hypothetical protein
LKYGKLKWEKLGSKVEIGKFRKVETLKTESWRIDLAK